MFMHSGYRFKFGATCRFISAVAGLAAVLACVPASHAVESEDAADSEPLLDLPEAQLPGSAWAVLRADGEHRRFLELAEQAGLRRVLDGEHLITVFAPADAAFDAIAEEEMAALLAPEGREALRELIGGHMLWGEIRSADVEGILMRPTLPGFAVILRWEGDENTDHAHAGHGPDCTHEHLAAGDLTVSDVTVVGFDGYARNGVVHRIETLIQKADAGDGSADPLAHAPACENNPDHAAGHAGRQHLESLRSQAQQQGGRGRDASRGTSGRSASAGGTSQYFSGLDAAGKAPRSNGGASAGGGGSTSSGGANGGGGNNGGSGGGGSGGGGGGGGCGCGGG